MFLSDRGTSPARYISSCESRHALNVFHVLNLSLMLTRLSFCLLASFHRLDHLMVSVPVDLESVILRSKSALLQNVPQGETRALSLS